MNTITEAALYTSRGVVWFPIGIDYTHQSIDELDQDGYMLVRTTVHAEPVTILRAHGDLFRGAANRAIEAAGPPQYLTADEVK